jgi:predicted O-methyltransferase YrrM
MLVAAGLLALLVVALVALPVVSTMLDPAAVPAAPGSADVSDPPAAPAPGGLQSADVPPAAAAVFQQIRAADTGQLAVSEEDGRFLRLMIVTNRTARALEIGGASGYSAIWMALGLRETGGRLTTIEYDPARAKELAENIRRAGLDDIVTTVAGDAFRQIPALTGDFDFVFLDAWKRDYKRFFDLVFPRLRPGGLFVAHNVVNKKEEMGDFLAAIHDNPNVMTSIVAPSGEGMSVSYKLQFTGHNLQKR